MLSTQNAVCLFCVLFKHNSNFLISEVSTQLSLIDVLLSDLDKTITPCSNKKNEKKEEETQDAMPDSTTNTEKSIANPFQCGDDVLVPNKDGRYYLGKNTSSIHCMAQVTIQFDLFCFCLMFSIVFFHSTKAFLKVVLIRLIINIKV